MAKRRKGKRRPTGGKRVSPDVKERAGTAQKGKAAIDKDKRMWLEIVAIAIIAFGAFMIFALFSASGGQVGADMHITLSGAFGPMAGALPFFVILYGGLMAIGIVRGVGLWRVVMIAIVYVLMCTVLAGRYIGVENEIAFIMGGDDYAQVFAQGVDGTGGGVVGSFFAKWIIGKVGVAGFYIACIAGLIISVILVAGMSVSQAADVVKEKTLPKREERQKRLEERRAVQAERQAERAAEMEHKRQSVGDGQKSSFKFPSFLGGENEAESEDKKKNIIDAVINYEGSDDIPQTSGTGLGLGLDDEALPRSEDDAEAAGEPEPKHVSVKSQPKKNIRFNPTQNDSNYVLPPIDLLTKGKSSIKSLSPAERKRGAEKLEQALRDFRVEARVVNVTPGPTVTRFEVEPDIGVKIQSIRNLEQDLARKLKVKSVRVVIVPGQSVVSIEAFNSDTGVVTLREIIESDDFKNTDGKISFALGKNISGENIIVDLKEMPHLLIAGTTGSGKSVCINSILLSILYRAKPSEVKLILIDPKVVELKTYNDLPHLLVPVVTDPERAAMALAYAVTEMNDRYKKFAENNVRSVGIFNAKMKKEKRYDEIMPQIVIVIDELQDLMMIAPKEVQGAISRLATMARAAGMHLIVATQQPLASILTSVIKANIPSRIAFAVSSNSASRVILDRPGAERLHGKGDMLFSPVGSSGDGVRIQGAFTREEDVSKVVGFIKKQMTPEYSVKAMTKVDAPLNEVSGSDEDEFFYEAVEFVSKSKNKQVSVSMLQRQFRIGYNRSARIVDMMADMGIVSESDGTNKPRRFIMEEAQLAAMLASAGQGELYAGMEDDEDWAGDADEEKEDDSATEADFIVKSDDEDEEWDGEEEAFDDSDMPGEWVENDEFGDFED